MKAEIIQRGILKSKFMDRKTDRTPLTFIHKGYCFVKPILLGSVSNVVQKIKNTTKTINDSLVHDAGNTKPATPSFCIYILFNASETNLLVKSISSLEQQKYKTAKLVLIPRHNLLKKSSEYKALKKKIDHISSNPFQIIVHQEIEENFTGKLNRGISQNLQFDYSLFMNAGDRMTKYALWYIAGQISGNPRSKLIYMDESIVDDDDQIASFKYKPDWNPDSLLSKNYLGSSIIFRTSLIKDLNYFNPNYIFSFQYDLALKFSEVTNEILHIPTLLYHKKRQKKPKEKIHQEEIEIICDYLKRQSIKAYVNLNNAHANTYSINYKLLEDSKVSIIIPTKDHSSVIDNCIKSIYDQSTYNNYEIIIIYNGKDKSEFFDVIQKWKKIYKDRLTIERQDIPFNYSRLNNYGAKVARGEYLLFLNDDTEVISKNWMESMLQHAQRPSTGTVGAKLLYPDNNLQHAGVILGIDGIASAPFSNKNEKSLNGHYYPGTVMNYSVLTGACLMMKKSIFGEVGGFDEQYKIEFNDYDLCLKIKSKGYNNVYTPEAVLYHYESYSRGSKYRNLKSILQYQKEKKKFVNKWKDYIQNDPCYNPNLSKQSENVFEPILHQVEITKYQLLNDH